MNRLSMIGFIEPSLVSLIPFCHYPIDAGAFLLNLPNIVMAQ
jgi:hypothetical protein